jgi:hypothetical protein
MKVECKRVNGREYLQVIDDRGYLHHIGVMDIQNLAVRQYFLGRKDMQRNARERDKQIKGLEERLLALGYPLGSKDEKGSVEHVARSLRSFYEDGNSIFILKKRSGILSRVYERIDKIDRKIFVFELLEKKIIADAESRGMTYSRQMLKKIVKINYRQISEEEKDQLINEYDKSLISALLERRSKK